jgi:hypothetical protein
VTVALAKEDLVLRSIIGIAIIVIIAALGGAAEADKARRLYAEAPLKDCTRLNGRWGYYGNPWCTPAEQLRWDRWDTRRR